MNRFIQKFLNSKTLVLTFLLIIGFSLYANSFSNKFFWDDDDNVVNNIFIKNWKYLPNIFTENLIAGAGLQSNYYRPLLLISYAFDYRIWGLRPFGYHLANTLLHILNAFLIFIIINFLIRKKTVALLTSILFLVHPLQTEVVTYMAGRADPLFVFFLLLAFWFFIKFNNSAQKKFIFLSFLFFIFSLLSKEMAIVFPVLLILYLVCFKERKINPASCSQWSIQSNHCSHEAHYPTAVPPKRDGIFSRCGINWLSIKKIAISIWPFLLIALIYFILRLTILNFGGTLNLYQEENLFTSRLDIRLFTFLKILLIYYKLIFAPIGLHMDRSIPLATTIFHWQVLLSLLILIGIIIGLIKSWQKQRLIFFAFGWFFINLLPTSNIIPVSGLLYEHWLYLPSVGIFLLGAILVEKIWSPPRPASLASLDASRSGPVGKRPAEEAGQKLGSFKWLLPYFMMIYLIWFSFLTVKRNLIGTTQLLSMKKTSAMLVSPVNTII